MDFDEIFEGWGVAQGPIDYILVAIQITIRIQKLKKKIFCLLLLFL